MTDASHDFPLRICPALSSEQVHRLAELYISSAAQLLAECSHADTRQRLGALVGAEALSLALQWIEPRLETATLGDARDDSIVPRALGARFLDSEDDS